MEILSEEYEMKKELGEEEIIEVGVDERNEFEENMKSVRSRGEKVYVKGI